MAIWMRFAQYSLFRRPEESLNTLSGSAERRVRMHQQRRDDEPEAEPEQTRTEEGEVLGDPCRVLGSGTSSVRFSSKLNRFATRKARAMYTWYQRTLKPGEQREGGVLRQDPADAAANLVDDDDDDLVDHDPGRPDHRELHELPDGVTMPRDQSPAGTLTHGCPLSPRGRSSPTQPTVSRASGPSGVRRSPRPPLAAGAPVGGSVHEGLPHDRRRRSGRTARPPARTRAGTGRNTPRSRSTRT